MKKDGFIATSLLYSFFILFCVLLLGLVGSFLHNRMLLENIIRGVKSDLSDVNNRVINRAEPGDHVTMILNNNGNPVSVRWLVIGRTGGADPATPLQNRTVMMISNGPVFAANRAQYTVTYTNTAPLKLIVDNYAIGTNHLTDRHVPEGNLRIMNSNDLCHILDTNRIQPAIRRTLLNEVHCRNAAECNPASYVVLSLPPNPSGCNISGPVIPANNLFRYNFSCPTSPTSTTPCAPTAGVICNLSTGCIPATPEISLGVRLVVEIRADIRITSGDGTMMNPYVLN